MKILILLTTLLYSLNLLAEENLPFYFFRINNNEIPDVVEKKVAQEKLCSLVGKNCQLDAPKIEKYSVLPLYEKPDEKSAVAGAFVNAIAPFEDCGTRRKDTEHCFLEALASFVTNKNGERRDFSHYVAIPAQHAKDSRSEMLGHRYNTAEERRSFFRYLRVMDVIPKIESKYNDPIIERWYALANPDGSGTKLWLKYKSDLRSIKYLQMTYDGPFVDISYAGKKISAFYEKYKNNRLEKFFNEEIRFGGYFICRMNKEYVQLIVRKRTYGYHEVSYKSESGKIEKFLEKERLLKKTPEFNFERFETKKQAALEKLKQKTDPCNEVMTKYEGIQIPLKDFYENGFFNSDYGVYDPEEIYFFGERTYKVNESEFVTVEEVDASLKKENKNK